MTFVRNHWRKPVWHGCSRLSAPGLSGHPPRAHAHKCTHVDSVEIKLTKKNKRKKEWNEAKSMLVTNQRFRGGRMAGRRRGGGLRCGAGRSIPWHIYSWGWLYEWPVDCWFNGVWRVCEMIDAALRLSQEPPRLQQLCRLLCTAAPKETRTMSTAVAATLLRWLNKNTASGGSWLPGRLDANLVLWFSRAISSFLYFVFLYFFG